MLPGVTRRQPDIFAIVQGAFRDAWPVMRSRAGIYGLLAALCALGALAVPFAYLAGADLQQEVRLQMALQPANLCGAVASFFAMAAVARTERPGFELTFVRVLAVVGIAIAVGAAAEFALVLLILPGVWIGTKWSLATWTYLLSDGENPFGESWAITTGHFWETFAYAILMAIAVGVLLAAGFFLPAFLAYLLPPAAVVLVPIAFLAYVFAYHVTFLGQMRLMLELRRLAAG